MGCITSAALHAILAGECLPPCFSTLRDLLGAACCGLVVGPPSYDMPFRRCPSTSQKWTCGRSLSRMAKSCASTCSGHSVDRARQQDVHLLRCVAVVPHAQMHAVLCVELQSAHIHAVLLRSLSYVLSTT